MLVLTRKLGERVVIGNDIVVTVIESWGNQVKIGIKAPKSVNIVREEIMDNKDARLSLLANKIRFGNS